MATSTTLDKGLAQYFYMVWDALEQSQPSWTVVTVGLALTGAHILMMLELCVHVSCICV